MPRLVYADWCEEHGDQDRAEFIRLQVKRSRLEHMETHGRIGRPDAEYGITIDDWVAENRKAAYAREWQLITAHDKEWTPTLLQPHAPIPVVHDALRYKWERGFIHAVQMTPQEFVNTDLFDQCLQQAPITDLYFEDITSRQMAVVTSCDRLQHVQGLHLHRGVTDEHLRLLATSHHLRLLRHLNVSFSEHFTEAGLQVFANSSAFPNLRVLDLSYNSNLNDAGLAALAASTQLQGLESLDLTCARLGAASAIALAASTTLPNLCHLGLGYNQIDNEGAHALATSSHLGSLRSLDLSYNNIDHRAAQALARHPSLGSLDRLAVYGNRMNKASALVFMGGDKCITSLGMYADHLSPTVRKEFRQKFVSYDGRTIGCTSR